MIHLIQQIAIQFTLTIISGFIFYSYGQNLQPPAEQLKYCMYALCSLFFIKFLTYYSGRFIKNLFLFITVGGFAKLSFKTISQLIAITYLGFFGFPVAYFISSFIFNVFFLTDLDLFESYFRERNSILDIFNIEFFMDTILVGAIFPYFLFSDLNPISHFHIDFKSDFNILKLDLVKFLIIFSILMISQFFVYTIYRRIVFRFRTKN